MDPKAAAKQFEELKKDLDAAYTILSATVARLPIPMRLPAWKHDQPLILRSLNLAWDLAGEESTDPRAIGRVRDMITLWVTAYEVGIVATASGPAPWRLRAIGTALATCRERAEQVNDHLDWLAREKRRIAREEAKRRRGQS
jgi:hypothetical protein